MPDIRNLTKTYLSLPHEDGAVLIHPGGKIHVTRVTGTVLKAVANGLVEVLGAVRAKLAFPINDLLPHEAVAAVDSLQDVDLLRSLLEEAKNKKVLEAIKRRLKVLEGGDDASQ
ncbi:hypothetical protein K8I61_11530 [bacterium]|nr:hypothetical protein [bacterium]